MAPAQTSLNLDEMQRFALMKFRRNVSDVCNKPEHNDYFLLRWLRARSWNSEAAEKMLRDSMNWREKWGVDRLLLSWQPPEPIVKYFPSGLSGFDKGGSPIIVLPFAGLDVWGLLHSVSKGDLIRMVIRELESHLKTAEEQSEKHGLPAKQLVCVMDMEGFSMRQYTWKPAGELVISLIQMYEANYPEILKMCYIVNAPKIFAFAFSIVKKFMNEYTLSKIKIYKNDPPKWKAVLLNDIDADQLPANLGGTMVDPDGDPKCPSKVRQGGKVPKEMYTKEMTDAQKATYNNVTLNKGEKHVIDLVCEEQGCFLKWEFGSDEQDIKFGIEGKNASGEKTVTLEPKKLSCATLETGLVPVDGPATFTVTFDNVTSKTKKLYYNVTIISQILQNMTITNLPGEEDIDQTVAVSN